VWRQTKLLDIQTKIVGFSYEPVIIPIYSTVTVPLKPGIPAPPIIIKNLGSTIAFNIYVRMRILKDQEIVDSGEYQISKLGPREEKHVGKADIEYENKTVIIELEYLSFHGIYVRATYEKSPELYDFVLTSIKHNVKKI